MTRYPFGALVGLCEILIELLEKMRIRAPREFSGEPEIGGLDRTLDVLQGYRLWVHSRCPLGVSGAMLLDLRVNLGNQSCKEGLIGTSNLLEVTNQWIS